MLHTHAAYFTNNRIQADWEAFVANVLYKPKEMKNLIASHKFEDDNIYHQGKSGIQSSKPLKNNVRTPNPDVSNNLAEILVITTYPPRECGIATYSQDLIKALKNQFSNSFSIRICALESGDSQYAYPEIVKFVLNTSLDAEYKKLASKINRDKHIKIVLVQHEFGFYRLQEESFLQLLNELSKPVIIVFHSVLPHPSEQLKLKVQHITTACESVLVMTHTSFDILKNDYDVPQQKIAVIAHGTHLVARLNKHALKLKYGLKGRKVLTTFGLLGSGKSIETTIDALTAIVKKCPEVMFLVIGKTHPDVIKEEGKNTGPCLNNR